MKQVLVTGGTGNLGKWVCDYLLHKNYAVSVLSSKETTSLQKDIAIVHGDLASGSGLAQATAEADRIIHCASNPGNFEQVDVIGTKNLLNSINKDRTRHLLYISIVGVDKSSYPYYQAKYSVEKMIAASGIPYTILRTTQFHSFIFSILQTFINDAPNSVINIPSGMRFQSVDIREVAMRLVDSLGEARGRLSDFGGPEVLRFEEMGQLYLDLTKRESVLQPAAMTGERYDLFRSGVNLCPENAYGQSTWRNFLETELHLNTII